MQELVPDVYIETGYAGVTLGTLNWRHGLILVDSPFRNDDIRSWRTGLLSLGGGIDRMMINLDAHYDRTIGARVLDSMVVGHDQLTSIIRSRPVTFKTQGTETGADWELYNNLGSIRWSPPEITFSDQLKVYWDDRPLVLEHHPGPSPAAIWAILPEQQIVFIGDLVTIGQPPFLAAADIPQWVMQLKELLAAPYRNFLVVCGRGGLAHADDIRAMVRLLEKVQRQLEKAAQRGTPPQETEKIAAALSAEMDVPTIRREHYLQRLRYGLYHYYLRRFHPTTVEPSEE